MRAHHLSEQAVSERECRLLTGHHFPSLTTFFLVVAGLDVVSVIICVSQL